MTRRERFLHEMDAVIPWPALMALIEPHYTKAGRGRRPLPLEVMLRVYFLQQWFDLPDPQAEDMLYDSESMRRFARVELGDGQWSASAVYGADKHSNNAAYSHDVLYAVTPGAT